MKLSSKKDCFLEEKNLEDQMIKIQKLFKTE